jgi:hypothetical protein
LPHAAQLGGFKDQRSIQGLKITSSETAPSVAPPAGKGCVGLRIHCQLVSLLRSRRFNELPARQAARYQNPPEKLIAASREVSDPVWKNEQARQLLFQLLDQARARPQDAEFALEQKLGHEHLPIGIAVELYSKQATIAS